MSVATKTLPTNLTFRPGTPVRVLRDVRRRYTSYLLEQEDAVVDYLETELHRKVSGTMTPGLWLSHLRDAHGWSQAGLGERLGGVKPSRVSDWENNHRPISKAVAKQLAKLFKVSAERFI